MPQTVEITVSELIQKWNLGQIPTNAKVSVTYDDTIPARKTPLRFGMFKGDFPDLELEEFQISEFRTDSDDGFEI